MMVKNPKVVLNLNAIQNNPILMKIMEEQGDVVDVTTQEPEELGEEGLYYTTTSECIYPNLLIPVEAIVS